MARKQLTGDVLKTQTGISHRAAVARILKIYRNATPEQKTDGERWYGQALATAMDIAAIGNIPVENAAAVIAHLSPQRRWNQNVDDALALVTGQDRPAGVLIKSWNRAQMAYSAPEPFATFNPDPRKSLKTKSFARNIVGITGTVTIDSWAARSVGLDAESKEFSRVGVYHAIEKAYRAAAKREGIDATTMQAVVWCAIRGKSDVDHAVETPAPF